MTFAYAQGVFSGQDETVALPLDKLAQEPFTRPIRVIASCIDEVPTGLGKGIEDPAALLSGRAPAPILAERHSTETELRNVQAAATQ